MSDPTKPVYAAVFLTKASRRDLLNVVQIKHENIFAEHMTLGFGRHMKPSYPIGEMVRFESLGVCEDERGQALTIWVEGIAHLFSDHQVPHITISTAEGIKPFYSNELIGSADAKRYSLKMSLEGVIDYFPRTLNELHRLPSPRGETGS